MLRSAAIASIALLLCVLPGLTGGQEETDPGGGVSGFVTRHGFPVTARVELRRMPTGDDLWYPPAALGPPLGVVKTDERGAYRFDHLAPGYYELRAITADAVDFEIFEIGFPGERYALVLSPAPVGKSVSGCAVWSDGTAFQGTVSSNTDVVSTDGKGTFELRTGVRSERRIVVFQKGRIRRSLLVPADGKVVVDADLVPFAGTVVAAEGGSPIAGATVISCGFHWKLGEVTAATETNAKGRFQLRAGPEESLFARAPGHLPRSVTADGPIEIRLYRVPMVQGRVVSVVDQRPVPGVPVIVLDLNHSSIESGAYMLAPAVRTITDGEGRFRLESPGAGDVMVFVLGRGWVTPGLELATNHGYNPCAISLSPGEHHQLTVAATPSPSVVGRVTGPDGQGVPGVTVSADIEPSGSAADRWQMGEFVGMHFTVSGTDGSYRIPTLIPGIPWEIAAWPAGRPWSESVPLRPEKAGEIALDIELPTPPPDRFVEVLVVSMSDGSPVPNAMVEVHSESAEIREIHRETTGPDGRARLGPFTRRPLDASAKHPAFSPRNKVPVPGSDGGEGDLALKIELKRGRVLVGVVRLPDGTPAPDAMFSVSRPGARSKALAHRTDAEGKFRVVGLAGGEWEIEVSHCEMQGYRWCGTKTAVADTEDIVITLREDTSRSVTRDPIPRLPGEPAERGVDIVVRTADGQPIKSGVIFVQTVVRGYRGRQSVGRRKYIRLIEGKARFSFEENEPLAWLDIRPDGAFGPLLVGPISPGESPVEFEVGPARRIAGKVVGPDGGGVRGARVFAVPVNGALLDQGGVPKHHGATYCDQAGKFRIEGLGDGEYLLRVSGPPTLLEPGPVTGRANGKRVEIRLATAVAPMVEVQDGEGKPLEGVEVRVHLPEDSRPLRRRNAVQSATTDSAGVARLARLDPDEQYRLVLDPGYDQPDLETLEVAGWKPQNGIFRLAAVRILRGVVLDRDGFPISRAAVWHTVPDEEGKAGKWKKTSAGKDGRFSIRGLPRRPIHLMAHPTWRSHRLLGDKLFEVDADEDETELEIDGGPILIARVARWPGNADATAYVGWEKGLDSSYGGWPLSRDGRLRVHCFEPGGKAVFWVGLPGGLMAYGKLEPDVESVLELRPGKTIEGQIELPKGARAVKLTVWCEHFTFEAPVEPGGAFRIWSLPEGTYDLFARAKAGSLTYGGDVKTTAGSTVKIELTPNK